MSCPPVSIGQLLSEDEIAVPSCISGKGMQSSLGTKVNMHSDTYIAKWIINDYRKWRTSVSRHTTLSTCLHSSSYSIWSPYIMYFKRYDKCTQSYENNLAEHPTNMKTKQSECSSPEVGSWTTEQQISTIFIDFVPYRQRGQHLFKVVFVQIGCITQKFTGFLHCDP